MKKKILFVIILITALFFIEPQMISKANAKEIPVEKITFDIYRENLLKGETFTLRATITPTNATNKSILWSSNNETVATVDQTGEVTAKGEGTALISAVTSDGWKVAKCEVVVSRIRPQLNGYTVNETEKIIENFPLGFTKSDFLWISKSNGTIQIKKNGREIQNSEKMGTGTTVTIDNDVTYTMVILGDVNGDGELTIVDLAKCKLHTIWKEKLTGCYEKAVDFNGDKVVNIIDLSRLKLKLIGKI